jgi:L-lysine 6-transaminase
MDIKRVVKTPNISFHRILLNLEKSEGSYAYDENTGKKYLDFFGMYSSLPLGYNHPVFSSKEYIDDILRVSSLKVTNCEMATPEFNRFVERFSNFSISRDFSCLHFSCTGALAVENAIKTCIFHKKTKRDGEFLPLSFRNSFHGITSYGNFLTDRSGNVKNRLSGFYDLEWPKIFIEEVHELESHLKSGKIACVILEPIQCTFGDIEIPRKVLDRIRELTLAYDVPLIFDEVQTGFCSTGDVWYHNRLGWAPDLVVFGKKSQVSGFFANESFSQIFESQNAGRLCVTFDGDLTDMVRCYHIMGKIQENNFKILENVKSFGIKIKEELMKISQIKNVRGDGVLIGFDLDTREKRDNFVQRLRERGMICNTAADRSIRMRPSLAVTNEDLNTAINIISESVDAI